MLLLTIYEKYTKGHGMTKKIKSVLLLLLCLALSCNLLLVAGAENDDKSVSGLLSISYRGDTAEYESNSEEAVLSAFDKGADFVSVSVRKSSDSELLLCDESESEVKGIPLKEMLRLLGEGDILILDFSREIKDEVYSLIESENAFSSAILRINDSTENIINWLRDKNENLQVIGVYDSFVVFTAVSHVKKLSEIGMDFVQYQSKNYFNEMFGSQVSKELFAQGSAKAVAAAYNPDLCGQRSDSEDGWNDLIKRGFSVIETNNVEAFETYITANEKARFELTELCTKAKAIEAEKYNTVSKENLLNAIETAELLMARDFSSSDELQSACSKLIFSMENLALKTGEDTQKGALNITVGKVIAAVLVGLVILVAQIYTYKMQKGKKR